MPGNKKIERAPIGNRLGDGALSLPSVTRIVSKSGGGQYDTIQSAIDSITDASASKPYVVEVYPGIYNENIVNKNWVTLLGVGVAESIVVTGTSGTLYTAPNTFSSVLFMRFKLDPVASGSIVCDATAGGEHSFTYCEFIVSSAANGITGKFIDADCDSILVLETIASYTMTGTSAGSLSHELISVSGTTESVINTNITSISINDIDDDLVFVKHASTGNLVLGSSFTTIISTNASYSGNMSWVSLTEKALFAYLTRSVVNMLGSGSGTATLINVDTTTNDGVLDSSANRYRVQGFANNYLVSAGTGDVVNVSYDDFISADGTTGDGLVNYKGSFGDGMLSIAGGGLFTIDTANAWHAYSLLSVTSVSEVSSGASKTGTVTGAYADGGGGKVVVASTGHALVDNDVITMAGSTNYNDVYVVDNVIAGVSFEITETYAAEGATGTFHMGPYLEVLQRGRYSVEYGFSASASGTNIEFDYVAFKNDSVIPGTIIGRKYSTSGDVGYQGGGGNFSLEKGDRVWFAVRNTTNSTNITITEGSFRLNKIS